MTSVIAISPSLTLVGIPPTLSTLSAVTMSVSVQRQFVMDGSDKMFMAHPVSLASVAALAVQFWELLACFTDEVEYLWIGKFKNVKLIYACSRYGVLLGQIGNQVLSFRFYSQQQSASAYQDVCPAIFIYQSIFTQVGLILLEMVLFIRVYALYNQMPKARWSLLAIFLLSTASELSGTCIFIGSVWSMKGCSSVKAEHLSIYFFGSVFCASISLQTLMACVCQGWGCTRPDCTCILDALRAECKESFGKVTDAAHGYGAAARADDFFLVLALVAVILVYNFLRELDMGIGNAILSWYNALLSIGTSRLVLEMRKLPVSNNEDNRMERDSCDSEVIEPVNLTVLSESLSPITTISAYPARSNPTTTKTTELEE